MFTADATGAALISVAAASVSAASAAAVIAATATMLHCKSSTHESGNAVCIGCQLPCIPSKQTCAAAALLCVMRMRHFEMKPYIHCGLLSHMSRC